MGYLRTREDAVAVGGKDTVRTLGEALRRIVAEAYVVPLAAEVGPRIAKAYSVVRAVAALVEAHARKHPGARVCDVVGDGDHVRHEAVGRVDGRDCLRRDHIVCPRRDERRRLRSVAVDVPAVQAQALAPGVVPLLEVLADPLPARLVAALRRQVVRDERERGVSGEALVRLEVEGGTSDERVVLHLRDDGAVVVGEVVEADELAEAGVERDGLQSARRGRCVRELQVALSVALHLDGDARAVRVFLVLLRDPHSLSDGPQAVRVAAERLVGLVSVEVVDVGISRNLPISVRSRHREPCREVLAERLLHRRDADLICVLRGGADEDWAPAVVVLAVERVAPEVEILVVGVHNSDRLRLVVDLEHDVARHRVERDGRPVVCRALGKGRANRELLVLEVAEPEVGRGGELRVLLRLTVKSLEAVKKIALLVLPSLDEPAPGVVADERHVDALLRGAFAARKDDVDAGKRTLALAHAEEPVRAATRQLHASEPVRYDAALLGVVNRLAESGIVDVAVERRLQAVFVPVLDVARVTGKVERRKRLESVARIEVDGLPLGRHLVEVAPAVVNLCAREELRRVDRRAVAFVHVVLGLGASDDGLVLLRRIRHVRGKLPTKRRVV